MDRSASHRCGTSEQQRWIWSTASGPWRRGGTAQAVTGPVPPELRKQLWNLRCLGRGKAEPGFNDPGAGRRVGILQVDNDGHRSIWDLAITGRD